MRTASEYRRTGACGYAFARMQAVRTRIDGLVALEPAVYGDERGFFSETYREEWSDALGLAPGTRFIQDNQSRSGRGVLRGMHFQIGDGLGKLVLFDGRTGKLIRDFDSMSTLNVMEAFMVWFKVCLVCGFIRVARQHTLIEALFRCQCGLVAEQDSEELQVLDVPAKHDETHGQRRR